jgi:hypothetical protein
VGRARAVSRLERRSRLAAADDEPGDAGGHQQVTNADQGGVATDARDGKDVADEPQALRVLERDVQRVEAAFEHGQDGRVWIDVARDQDRHSAPKREDDDQVQRQAGSEEDGPGDAPVEPNGRKQQGRADDVERPGSVDRGRSVGRAKQRDGDLGGERRQQQFDVLDAELAQSANVAANHYGDHKRRGDDCEEQKQGLAGACSLQNGRLRFS